VFFWADVHGHHARVCVISAENTLNVSLRSQSDRMNETWWLLAQYSRSFGAFTCLASVSSRRHLFLPDACAAFMLAEAVEGTGPEQVFGSESLGVSTSDFDGVDETISGDCCFQDCSEINQSRWFSF
jgi:hypothetical protein